MSAPQILDQHATDPQVLITRLFDAPRELVFKAWTDPQQLPLWFAPQGCSIEFRVLEIRVGGRFLSCIRTPQDYQCWCAGEYREIVPSKRIVFTMAVSDSEGRKLTATEASMDPDWPQETVITVTFTDLNGKTQLTLHQTVSESLAKKTGAHPSWLSMFDRLGSELAKSRS